MDKGIVEGLLYLIDANKDTAEINHDLKTLIMTKSPEKITTDLIYNNLYESKTRQKNVDYKNMVKPTRVPEAHQSKIKKGAKSRRNERE